MGLRLILVSVLLLLCNSSGVAQRAAPLCVDNPAKMPTRWRSSGDQHKTFATEPWQAQDAEQARNAVKTAAHEIIGFFKDKPAAVLNLWDDSIEALMQITYASENARSLDGEIHEAARKNLSILIKSYDRFDRSNITCDEFRELLPLALFAHKLYAEDDKRTVLVTDLTNAAYRECYSLEDATGIKLSRLLQKNKFDAQKVPSKETLELLFDAHVWSLWLLEVESVPALMLPKKSNRFVSAVWARLRDLPLPGPEAFEGGVSNTHFTTLADLATHIGHVPTAVHRFKSYVEDHSKLYDFHRQNFYKVMASGDLDLFASFVDALRQYGCTPTNDRQVRDGTRYLLKVFQSNGDRWMHRKRDNSKNDSQFDYKRVHRPWTAMLGLRERKMQPPVPGTFGHMVRKRLSLAEKTK